MKFTGSKSRMAKDIVPVIQVILSAKTRMGNDNNEYLIDFWNAMQNDLDLSLIFS